MDFEFTKEEENGLLSRREIDFVLLFDGATPSRKEILGKLCALKNVNENLVVIDSLKSHFGKQELSGQVRIYPDEETRNSIELAYLIKRSASPASEDGGEEA